MDSAERTLAKYKVSVILEAPSLEADREYVQAFSGSDHSSTSITAPTHHLIYCREAASYKARMQVVLQERDLASFRIQVASSIAGNSHREARKLKCL